MIRVESPGIPPIKDIYLWRPRRAFVGFYCLILGVREPDTTAAPDPRAPILWARYQVVKRGYKGGSNLYMEQR